MDWDWSNIGMPMWQFWLLVGVVLLAVLATTIATSVVNKRRGRQTTLSPRDVAYGAMVLALSFVLSLLPVLTMPFGGSITVGSMLPLLLYAYFFGFGKGVVVALAWMVLYITHRPFILTPWSAVLDYVVPALAVCMTGILSDKLSTKKSEGKANSTELNSGYSQWALPVESGDKIGSTEPNDGYDQWASSVSQQNTVQQQSITVKNDVIIDVYQDRHYKFFVGVVFYFVLRYFSHVLSGVIFWSQDTGWSMWEGDLSGWSAWSYSLSYNAVYLLLDTLVLVALAILFFRSKILVATLRRGAVR